MLALIITRDAGTIVFVIAVEKERLLKKTQLVVLSVIDPHRSILLLPSHSQNEELERKLTALATAVERGEAMGTRAERLQTELHVSVRDCHSYDRSGLIGCTCVPCNVSKGTDVTQGTMIQGMPKG